MGNTRNTGYLANVIKVDGSDNVTLNNAGNITSISGAINSDLNSVHISTGSLNTFTGSASGRLNNIETFSSSTNSRLSSIETTTASFSPRVSALETFTGSANAFVLSKVTQTQIIILLIGFIVHPALPFLRLNQTISKIATGQF